MCITTISNGVRQGGVLSPIPFSIYLDSLLLDLSVKGIGCHWDHHFTGAYADDLVLLAHFASALRFMLKVCEDFASLSGLRFNPEKTTLMKFHQFSHMPSLDDNFIFCNQSLLFKQSVVHLGNKLTYNLSDEDILLKSLQMTRAANYLIYTFSFLPPTILSYLFSSFCLSLYGACLWNLSSSAIHSIEVACNNCLRKMWRLPRNTHTGILHCTAGIQSIRNIIYHRFSIFVNNAIHVPNRLVSTIFRCARFECFNFTGYNYLYGDFHLKTYSQHDVLCGASLQLLKSKKSLSFYDRIELDSLLIIATA